MNKDTQGLMYFKIDDVEDGFVALTTGKKINLDSDKDYIALSLVNTSK